MKKLTYSNKILLISFIVNLFFLLFTYYSFLPDPISTSLNQDSFQFTSPYSQKNNEKAIMAQEVEASILNAKILRLQRLKASIDDHLESPTVKLKKIEKLGER